MTKDAKIIVNAVDCIVESNSKHLKKHLYSLLSYEINKDYYAFGEWVKQPPEVFSFFDYAEGTFPAGFFYSVNKNLRDRGYEYDVERLPLPSPLGDDDPSVPGFPNDPRYSYQLKTVAALQKNGRMIAQIATAGGKSVIAVLATLRLGRNTLFLTTREVLMRQMKGWFERAGLEVGVIGGGEWNPKPNLNVAMVQTLHARLKNPDTEQNVAAILNSVEFVIGEEAHEVGGVTYYDLLRQCHNAYYRLALTATPFMRDEKEANMRLMASFGPVGMRVEEKTLIDNGVLATPKFKYVPVNIANGVQFRNQWQTAIKKGVVENKDRNLLILREVKEAVKNGLSVIVLVHYQKHGVTLKKLFSAAKLNVDFIFGETDSLKRQNALNNIRDGRIDVLIGSTILDVGVDVPAIGMIVLAGAGKAEIGLRQRIGRGLRAKKNSPNICFVVDFEDNFNKILSRHSILRREIVENTPGFVENILPFGVDFDYSVFNH